MTYFSNETDNSQSYETMKARDRWMVFLMVLQMGKWNTAGFRRLDVGMPWVKMTGMAVNINKIPYEEWTNCHIFFKFFIIKSKLG